MNNQTPPYKRQPNWNTIFQPMPKKFWVDMWTALIVCSALGFWVLVIILAVRGGLQ